MIEETRNIKRCESAFRFMDIALQLDRNIYRGLRHFTISWNQMPNGLLRNISNPILPLVAGNPVAQFILGKRSRATVVLVERNGSHEHRNQGQVRPLWAFVY